MDEVKVLGIEEASKDCPLDEPNAETQSVISLLLTKQEDDCNNSLQVDFPVNCKVENSSEHLSRPVVTTSAISASTASSPLNISHIELSETGMLLESGDVIQNALDGTTNAIQLETASSCFVQGLAVTDESDSCDGTTKFIDGQAVRLEDGTTAFLHSVPREGLQPVQLEDGTMAYLSQPRDELFNGEASGLDLDHLSSSQMQVDNVEEKEAMTKVVVTANQTKGHSRGGEKAFLCPYEGCDRVYTTPHHLKVHERSHTGDRPFKCAAPNCGKAFATGYGLKSHTRVHTGETPYKCSEVGCGKAFKTSGDLQKHLRTHTGERPFKCPFTGCDRAFTTSNIRKVHIRTHTGEKPYICEACGRAFASATNFKNHIRIHTGEKPYTCNVPGCNKKFTEYSSLYKHHVVHTRDKPYVCTQCGKHYRQTSTLAMHERTAHRNVGGKNGITCTSEDKIYVKVEKNVPDSNKIPCLELITADVNAPDGAESAESAQHSPVYAIQLPADANVGTSQQIFLLTDPAQIAALQQFTQIHLQSALPLQNNDVVKAD